MASPPSALPTMFGSEMELTRQRPRGLFPVTRLIHA